jgi:hypothetical protein
VVFLDRAGYFYEGRLRAREWKAWYFSPKLPESNAVEDCWNQLQEWLKHRLIPDRSTLKDYVPKGLNTVNEPNIWKHMTGKEPS